MQPSNPQAARPVRFAPKSNCIRWLTAIACLAASLANADSQFQISGRIQRPADDCQRVLVFVCDQASGEPLCERTRQPFTLAIGTTNDNFAMDWFTAIPDAGGHFQFTNLPAGHYLVVAQSWPGRAQPTNLMKFRGETVHLLGRAEVDLPSNAAANLQLLPPGTNTVRFDQQFPNDDGFLMLGTRPPRGDPVLGWLGWGTNFVSHLIGCNAMPAGRTTVHGLPAEAYAAIFMNDDSPGFGACHIVVDETNPIKMPIVAGWSDGYKIPPTNLVWLVDLLQTNRIRIDQLLGLTNRPPAGQSFFERERARSRLVLPIWNKEIILPTGQKTRVADLLTALGYARLSGKIKY